MDDLARFSMGFVVAAVVFALVLLWWASHGFDRAKSNRVDSRVGDDPKSSKSINANDNAFDFSALSFSGNTVGGRVALAA